MTSRSIVDRIDAARHTVKGSMVGKSVTKATSREIIGPKKKHVDFLLNALEEDNVNIPELGDLLFERCSTGNWVIVFKALITCHHLLSNGNERFIQYCASRSVTWMLHNFLDKSGVQGYDMSHAIRRYSHYLNEKARSYMEMGFDFCRLPRGKEEGVLRNTDTQKLIRALPVIQRQIDALVSTEIRASDLMNGVITAAFMLLFKDLIRLFACYNDGIINLLEKYFDMKKQDCKIALDIYKKFVNRMDRVSEFLKAAEEVGIDRGDIPDLTRAPGSLLEALENHLHALEKGRTVSPPAVPISLPAISIDADSGKSADPFQSGPFDNVPADYIEQEKKALEMFEKSKQQTNKIPGPPVNSSPPKASEPARVLAPPVSQNAARKQPEVPSGASDLLQLSSAFTLSAPESSYPRSVSEPLFDPNAWNAPAPTPIANGTTQLSTTNPFLQTDAGFAPAFQNSTTTNADLLGGVLEPTRMSSDFSSGSVSPSLDQNSRSTDINSSLARITKSLDDLSVNTNMQKAPSQRVQHQWKPQQPQVRTGGAYFQDFGPARSTLPAASTQANWGSNVSPVPMSGYAQPMAFNTTAPGFGYSQPGMQSGVTMGQPRPPTAQGGFGFDSSPLQDPFGPIPGSQARF